MFVEQNSDGYVYARFEGINAVSEALRTKEALNNQNFDGIQI